MSDLQAHDFETADYRSVLRRLTTLDAEATAMRAEAVRWHDGRVAATEDVLREADEQLAAARRAVAEAQRSLEEVDARAAGLWSEFVHKLGPVAERYGRTVPPAAIPRQRGERDADEYLEEVATRVAYVPPARPLTSAVQVLFGVFGFLGGLVGVAAYQLLRRTAVPAGGDWTDALPVVGLVVLLACPVLAVVGAKRVADRRGVGLTATTVATVLVTGLVTAAVLLAALRV
jgi:hypothetical protein